MKAVKYRAKTKEGGAWISGYYMVHEGPLLAFYEGQQKGASDKHYIGTTQFADWNMPREYTMVEVSPSTLGMFTGLIDRNGKEIYTGDIIKTSHEIKYRPSAKRYKLIQWIESKYKVGFNLGESNNGTCEIVGNMFDDWNLVLKCKERQPVHNSKKTA